MEINFFFFQYRMEWLDTSIVIWIPLPAERMQNSLVCQIFFKCLARILASQVFVQDHSLCILDIEAHSLLPALPVPPSLTRHRHIQWFCGCTDHNRHQIHPLILSISSYALFTKSLSCLLQWLIILFSFEYWRQTGIGWAYPSIIPISDKVLHIRVLSSSIVISFVSDLPYKSSSFILAHIASQRALSWHLPPSLFILCTIPQRFSSAL